MFLLEDIRLKLALWHFKLQVYAEHLHIQLLPKESDFSSGATADALIDVEGIN